jgi:hypothetical protein
MKGLFKAFGRLILTSLQVAAYSSIFVLQTIWFVMHKRSDKIGEAFGWYSKALVDSLVGLFQIDPLPGGSALVLAMGRGDIGPRRSPQLRN